MLGEDICRASKKRNQSVSWLVAAVLACQMIAFVTSLVRTLAELTVVKQFGMKAA